MKVFLPFLAAAIVASAASGQQPSAPPPLVTTSGSALIRVVPDLADLYFMVEIRSADLDLARKQHAERATKILAVLRAAGVAEAELQTSQIETSPYFTDDREETNKLKFYRLFQSISCTTHDVKKVPEITAAAVMAGATGVQDATLRTSALRKYRDEARVKAIRAAREKAVSLATELGAKVGKPYMISEGAASDGMRLSNSNTMQIAQTAETHGNADDDTLPTFAPGTINVIAEVSVSFVLE